MKQLKAEIYKLKYSNTSKWLIIFMLFMFFIPLVLENDTLFMTFGDYKNLNSIGWICYIDNFNNIHFKEIARFSLSINFFIWIGLIVYIVNMIGKEYQLGTLRLPVVYGVNKTKIFITKLFVLNAYFFLVYTILEIGILLALGFKYKFIFTFEHFLQYVGVVLLNILAMIGLEMFAVILILLTKNIGLVCVTSCIYFFAGAITYPMVYDNFYNQSLAMRLFCYMNPATYMYNLGGFRLLNEIIVGTIVYGIGAIFIGIFCVSFIVERQEF